MTMEQAYSLEMLSPECDLWGGLVRAASWSNHFSLMPSIRKSLPSDSSLSESWRDRYYNNRKSGRASSTMYGSLGKAMVNLHGGWGQSSPGKWVSGINL